MEKRKTNIDMLKMRLRSSQKSKLMGFNRLVRKLIASMVSHTTTKYKKLELEFIFRLQPRRKLVMVWINHRYRTRNEKLNKFNRRKNK